MIIDPTESEASVPLLLGLLDREKVKIKGKLIIVSVGGFKNDSRESSLADVVLSVKAAMENGDTVLLLNSEPVRSAFYDLFNLHTTAIPSKAEKGTSTTQFVTNLAIGSLSLPCIVHPNFKIIVHVPTSQIPNTQTPFLDRYVLLSGLLNEADRSLHARIRFEKYVLSIRHMLEEKLSHQENWKSLSVAEADGHFSSKSFSEIVEAGIRDGVHRLHDEASNGRLLYGFHPEETIASIMYQSIQLAIERGKAVPVMPTSFSALTAAEVSKMLSEEYYDPSMPPIIQSIRLLVRQGLYKLLQLARPEQLFLVDSLPPSYRREYLLAQEHFNVILFARLLLSSADAEKRSLRDSAGASLGHVYARKWVLYSRSSADIINIGKRELQIQVANLLAIDFDQLSVLSLSDYSSRGNFLAAMEEFFHKIKNGGPTRPQVLICVAAMDSVSNDQVNFFRGRIDEYRFENPNIFVLLVLHFPPERVFSSQSAYPAVFLNEWDFMYFDAFGLLARDASSIENVDRALHRGVVSGHGEIDGRSWLASAFGLVDEKDESASPLTAAFEQVFSQLVAEVRSTADMNPHYINAAKVSQIRRLRPQIYDCTFDS